MRISKRKEKLQTSLLYLFKELNSITMDRCMGIIWACRWTAEKKKCIKGNSALFIENNEKCPKNHYIRSTWCYIEPTIKYGEQAPLNENLLKPIHRKHPISLLLYCCWLKPASQAASRIVSTREREWIGLGLLCFRKLISLLCFCLLVCCQLSCIGSACTGS